MNTTYEQDVNLFMEKFVRHNNIRFIYGGVTEQTLENRLHEHVCRKQPPSCDNSWIIEKITTINIEQLSKRNYYKKIISEIENYLIQLLGQIYKNKCKNHKNDDGTFAQLGGAGININKLQKYDAVQVYVYYKLN